MYKSFTKTRVKFIHIMTFEDPIEFIKLLKSEHKAIIATVSDIDDQQGGPSNVKDSVDKLNRITDVLFSHLEKEDKKLYPTLLANEHTVNIAKKYSYDMERLSCIAVDFFKRYCVNREGLKIFVEDFINGYSIFRGLLKVRIKREETELYPSFILLQSGVLYSEVIDYVKEQETKNQAGKKNVFVFSKDEHYLEALALAMEITGYHVSKAKSLGEISSLSQNSDPAMMLLDITNPDSELHDLIISIKKPGIKLVGYSTKEIDYPKENINQNLDDFIQRPAFNMEEFSDKISKLIK